MADQLVHDVVVAHKRSDVDRSQTGLEHQDTEKDNQTLENATTAPPSCRSENTPPHPRTTSWMGSKTRSLACLFQTMCKPEAHWPITVFIYN